MRLSRSALERLRKMMAGLRPTPPPMTIWDVFAGAAQWDELPNQTREDLEAFLADPVEVPDPLEELIAQAG